MWATSFHNNTPTSSTPTDLERLRLPRITRTLAEQMPLMLTQNPQQTYCGHSNDTARYLSLSACAPDREGAGDASRIGAGVGLAQELAHGEQIVAGIEAARNTCP